MQAVPGTLPDAGGHRDQEAGLLRKIRTSADYYWGLRAYEGNATEPGSAATWRSAHRDLVEMHTYVETLRNAEQA